MVGGGGGGTYGVTGATYGAGVTATGGEALTGPPGKSPAALALATSAPRNTTTLELGWSTRYRTGRDGLSALANVTAKMPIRMVAV